GREVTTDHDTGTDDRDRPYRAVEDVRGLVDRVGGDHAGLRDVGDGRQRDDQAGEQGGNRDQPAASATEIRGPGGTRAPSRGRALVHALLTQQASRLARGPCDWSGPGASSMVLTMW